MTSILNYLELFALYRTNSMEELKCLFCDGQLCWDSDENANNVFAEYDETDSAVVHFYHCLKCGRSYEICEPVKEERRTTYKEYWND